MMRGIFLLTYYTSAMSTAGGANHEEGEGVIDLEVEEIPA